MILCAGRNELFDFATPIGVGLVESASNLTQIVLEHKPTFFFFIGTAGSYGHHSIFDLLYSHHATNIELGFLENHCYTPLKNHIEAKIPYVSRETGCIVNSSNYITTNTKYAEKLFAQGIVLENMEFFSVLSIANKFDIPCSGLFVVTNYCNERAHDDFVLNHSKAKELLTFTCKKLFEVL